MTASRGRRSPGAARRADRRCPRPASSRWRSRRCDARADPSPLEQRPLDARELASCLPRVRAPASTTSKRLVRRQVGVDEHLVARLHAVELRRARPSAAPATATLMPENVALASAERAARPAARSSSTTPSRGRPPGDELRAAAPRRGCRPSTTHVEPLHAGLRERAPPRRGARCPRSRPAVATPSVTSSRRACTPAFCWPPPQSSARAEIGGAERAALADRAASPRSPKPPSVPAKIGSHAPGRSKHAQRRSRRPSSLASLAITRAQPLDLRREAERARGAGVEEDQQVLAPDRAPPRRPA